VPADALAIARVPQVNRVGWAARQRALQTGVNRETLNVKRETNSTGLKPHASRLTKKQVSVAESNQAKKRR